ncbi:Uncharacterised protein [Bordetella pertussis]|nr:Uncharacterised protein [Bordetella pertussis]CFP66452.1 Uncharacterised protein [Bordetella pertussis]CFU91417.1 Uncharacterised protein [Bordetella pertussis]CPO84729.1 Uncharacterised protein [Bordetella pertussis]
MALDQLAGAIGRRQRELEAVGNLVQTVFDSDTGHGKYLELTESEGSSPQCAAGMPSCENNCALRTAWDEKRSRAALMICTSSVRATLNS